MATVFAVGCDTPSNSKLPESGIVKHGCEWSEILPGSRPSDFKLLFKYGYGTINNRNVLNTFNGTYTKDLGMDPPITIDFSLSDEDLDRIYQKMVEIDFFCYPDEFVIPVPEGGIVSAFTPYQGYYFRVECSHNVKELRWEDNITNKNEDADKLRWLTGLIISLIESKDEYWDLPPSRGIII
jgi:hypothetical protein